MKILSYAQKIKNILFSEKGSIGDKSKRAGIWTFILQILSRSLFIGKTIFTARLLFPEDFGLFGIVLLSISILERFSQTGFNQAIIQKKECSSVHLNTAWTIQVVRGVFLFIIILLISPLIAIFFNQPNAVPLIQASAVIFLLQGLTNIGIVLLQKELNFQKKFIYDFGGSLIDFIITVVVVYMTRSVWGFMAGLLASNLVKLISSYLIHNFRPKIRLAIKETKELYNFGKYIFLQNIVLFFVTEGGDIFVGRFLGIMSLGYYKLAYRFANISAVETTHVISKVAFPAFSQLQVDTARLSKAVLKTLEITSLISIPMGFTIFMYSEEFTLLVLGEKWLPIVTALKIISISGIFRSIGAIFGPVYQSKARVDLSLKVGLVALLIIVFTIYPLINIFGIVGTAISITLSMIIAVLLSIYITSRLLHITVQKILIPLLIPLVSSILMYIFLEILNKYIPISSISHLVLFGLLNAITYLTILSLIYKAKGNSLFNTIVGLVKIKTN